MRYITLQRNLHLTALHYSTTWILHFGRPFQEDSNSTSGWPRTAAFVELWNYGLLEFWRGSREHSQNLKVGGKFEFHPFWPSWKLSRVSYFFSWLKNFVFCSMAGAVLLGFIRTEIHEEWFCNNFKETEHTIYDFEKTRDDDLVWELTSLLGG